MNMTFDFKKMGELLYNFNEITNVSCTLIDTENNVLCTSRAMTAPFCYKLRNSVRKNGKLGVTLCEKCDIEMAKFCSANKMQSYTYRCHAGLMETIIPIYLNGETVAYIYLGQYLDSEDVDRQWEFTKKVLDENIDKVDDEFKNLFYKLKCLPMPFVASSTAILNACFNFIAAECMMQNSPQSDFQLLNEYIKYNYAKNLSITSIANNLSISKSKLCKLAKEHKTTINDMIKERRLKNAKSLLESTVYSISEIASKVGIPDYNYFTILFKKEEGVTPSEYRKNNYTQTEVNY